jgi:hypothetical protein
MRIWSCLVAALIVLALMTVSGAVMAGPLDVALSASPAVPATAVSGQVPDTTLSFFVPQTGTLAAPTEGTDAIRFFRTCPNSDGASFPNNARIKVVVKDVDGNPISGIAAEDICVLFNGGTAAQGFSGMGADSIIANSLWNSSPLCPDVRCLQADAPTDAAGTAYLTFLGAHPSNPGVALRDPNRKWGHFDSELPVYVLGIKLAGRLTSGSPNGSYVLRVKNVDGAGGLQAVNNQGERVTVSDLNGVANSIGEANALSYWRDFDNSGVIGSADLNIITVHLNHNCTYPLNP